VRILVLALKLLVTIAVGAAALAGSIALLAPAGKTLEAAATPLGQLDFAINAPPSPRTKSGPGLQPHYAPTPLRYPLDFAAGKSPPIAGFVGLRRLTPHPTDGLSEMPVQPILFRGAPP